MKASEILRKLADMIDSNAGTPDTAHKVELNPVEVDNTDHTEDSVYISPLQQKLELLKKAAGVDSAYDNQGEQPDELNIIKQNAGLPVVMQVAAEDNDVFENKE